MISEASLIPWLLALAAALLVLGYLTAVGCRNMTVAAAEREREAAEQADARPGLRGHPRPGPGPHRPRDHPVRALPARAGRRLAPRERDTARWRPRSLPSETGRARGVAEATVRSGRACLVLTFDRGLLVEGGRAVGVDGLHGGLHAAVALVVGRGSVPQDAQRVDVQVLEFLHDRGLVQVAGLGDGPVDLQAGVPAFLAVVDRVVVAEAGRLSCRPCTP